MDKSKVAMEADQAQINAIVAEYSQQRWALIPLVQKIQNEFGYIPQSPYQLLPKPWGSFPARCRGLSPSMRSFTPSHGGKGLSEYVGEQPATCGERRRY